MIQRPLVLVMYVPAGRTQQHVPGRSVIHNLYALLLNDLT